MENNYIIIKSAYNDNFRYYSQSSQDKFVSHLFNFKKNGYFLDIGSDDEQNNSEFFDLYLDWKGICIDIKEGNYSHRKNTKFYQLDATKINYNELFKSLPFPNIIDYLSLDVDDLSNTVMKLLPLKDYKFSTITIEHDSYVDENKRKPEQRQYLTEMGYHLLCSDVWFSTESSGNHNYFEDWWVNPATFDLEKYKFLKCDKTHATDIINKFNK